MKDYSTAVRDTYRKIIGDHSSFDEPADRQECVKLAAEEILADIRAGEVERPEIGSLVTRDLMAQDRSDKAAADSMIDALYYGGQDTLDLDPLLDVVVTLGGGRRKPWRLVTDVDWELMDEVRYRNVERQQQAYSQWRPKFLACRSAYRAHGTTEAVLAAGPCGDPS